MSKKTILSILKKTTNRIKKTKTLLILTNKKETKSNIVCKKSETTNHDYLKIPITQSTVIEQFSLFKTIEKVHFVKNDFTNSDKNYYSFANFLKTFNVGEIVPGKNKLATNLGIEMKEISKYIDKLIKNGTIEVTKNNRLLMKDVKKLSEKTNNKEKNII
jgi:biotin operon repressor